MKKYIRPRAEAIVFSSDVLMVSDENETPKDHVESGDLAIRDIESV